MADKYIDGELDLVQGDFGYSFEIQLQDPDNNNAPIDVSTATAVRMYFKKRGATTLTATLIATLVTDGTDGQVKFTWPQGALDVAGDYVGEFEIEGGATLLQTVYPLLKAKVRKQEQVV